IRICIHTHSLRVSLDVKYRDYIFVFQKAGTRQLDIGNTDTRRNFKYGRRTNVPRSGDMKPPMSVLSRPVIQNLQDPVEIKRKIIGRELRSVARLYGFNDGYTLLGEWPNLTGGFTKVARSTTDRKLKTAFIGR